MKFLADVNIEKPIVDELRKLGYDIVWITNDRISKHFVVITKEKARFIPI